MHSDLRTNAIILLSLLDADPDSPIIEKLVAYILGKRRNGAWRNTQENSYALISLSEYFMRKEKGKIDFNFTGRIDGKKLRTIKFNEIRKEIINIAMEEIANLTKELTLILEKTGKGKLFWMVNLSFYQKGMDFQGINQGFYVQKFYEDLNTGEREHSQFHKQRSRKCTILRSLEQQRERL